ncbi:MAG: molybdopterin-binding protein [Eubacteriales bacterium]|nr:molybdopterin-binding protein [Eubacteriales bacterium]
MTAELISVGTEILLGNIVNTNAQYLAKKLADLGIEVYYQTVVGDNPERIRSALDIAYSRAQMVILTGGLGPTKDDLTKEMLISYFGKKPVLDQTAYEMLEQHLKELDVPMSDGLRKQAIVPDDSMILYNHHGTAPGCIMEQDGKVCILLPGPPKEMKPMFEECCERYLNGIRDKVFVSMNIKMLDFDHAPVAVVGEAPVADALGELLDSENPTVATYAKDDGCLIRVTASAADREEALALANAMVEKCRAILKEEYIRYIREDT